MSKKNFCIALPHMEQEKIINAGGLHEWPVGIPSLGPNSGETAMLAAEEGAMEQFDLMQTGRAPRESFRWIRFRSDRTRQTTIARLRGCASPAIPV